MATLQGMSDTGCGDCLNSVHHTETSPVQILEFWNTTVSTLLLHVLGSSGLNSADRTGQTQQQDPSTTAIYATDSNSPEHSNTETSAIHLYLSLIFTCLIMALALTGSLGNTVSVVVLAHHGLSNDSSNLLLLALAVNDALYCITVPCGHIASIISLIDPSLSITVDTFMTVCFRSFNRLLNIAAIFVVTLIAIERAVAVTLPLRVARIFSPRKCKVMIVGLYGALGLYLIPVWNMYAVTWTTDGTNRSVAMLTFTEFSVQNEEIYLVMYSGILNSLGVILIVIVLVGTIATSLALLRAARNRRRLKTNNTTNLDLKAIKIVLLVCSITFLCYTPSIIFDYVFRSAWPPYSYTFLQFIWYSFDLLYVFNATVNFLIYVTLSLKFRQTYKRLFCPTSARAQ